MSTVLFLLSIVMTGSHGEIRCPLVKSVYPPVGTYLNPSETLNFGVTIEFDEPMFLYSFRDKTLKLDVAAAEAELNDILKPKGNGFSAASLLLVTKDRKEESVNHRPVSFHSPGNNKVIVVWEVGSMKEIVWTKYSQLLVVLGENYFYSVDKERSVPGGVVGYWYIIGSGHGNYVGVCPKRKKPVAMLYDYCRMKGGKTQLIGRFEPTYVRDKLQSNNKAKPMVVDTEMVWKKNSDGTLSTYATIILYGSEGSAFRDVSQGLVKINGMLYSIDMTLAIEASRKDTQIVVPIRQLKRVREKIEMYGTDGRFVSLNINYDKAWKDQKLDYIDKLFQKYTPTFEQYRAYPQVFGQLTRILNRNMKSDKKIHKYMKPFMTSARATAARCKSAYIHFRNNQTGDTQYLVHLLADWAANWNTVKNSWIKDYVMLNPDGELQYLTATYKVAELKGIRCPPCAVRNSHCHECGSRETFHYLEEGQEEFDVFKPLSERRKYKVMQQLKVQAIINGERFDVTKKLRDPSPENDVNVIIADTIIPYALLVSALPAKPQGRISLEEVATVPQNMAEYKGGCGSFYIHPDEFKASAKCSQPIGTCIGEPISSQLNKKLPAFHDLRLFGNVTMDIASGRGTVPRAYITSNLKQIVLRYGVIEPIKLEGLEIDKIAVLEPFIEYRQSHWRRVDKTGTLPDPCAVWTFKADLTPGNESKANMTVILKNSGLGIGLFVARIKCPAFGKSFHQSHFAVYLAGGESRNVTFFLDASQFGSHNEVSQECRFRASISSQPMFSNLGKSMGTCRRVVTSYVGSFTPVCELRDEDPIILLQIFEAHGDNQTKRQVRRIEGKYSLHFITAVEIKLTAQGGTLKAISNIRVVCQRAYVGVNIENLLLDEPLMLSAIVDEYYSSFPQAVFFFGRASASRRTQCYFEVWAHRPYFRCHKKEIILKEKIVLTPKDRAQLMSMELEDEAVSSHFLKSIFGPQNKTLLNSIFALAIIAVLLDLLATAVCFNLKCAGQIDLPSPDELLMNEVKLEGLLQKTEDVWKLLPRYLHMGPYGPFFLLDCFRSQQLILDELSSLEIVGRLLKEGHERQVCINNVKNVAACVLDDEVTILVVSARGVYQLCQPEASYSDCYSESVKRIKETIGYQDGSEQEMTSSPSTVSDSGITQQSNGNGSDCYDDGGVQETTADQVIDAYLDVVNTEIY